MLAKEREDAHPNFSFNRTVSLLSVSPNRFSFSADMEGTSELAEKALNEEFRGILRDLFYETLK